MRYTYAQTIFSVNFVDDFVEWLLSYGLPEPYQSYEFETLLYNCV